MGRNMGFDFGLESADACIPRKFRWLLKIDDVSAAGVNSLPPLKSARPSLTFKETEVQHLTETIYFPTKPDWKPINLVLFDLKKNKNPVVEWVSKIYDPNGEGTWRPSGNDFKRTATLEMYDGCGEVMESWVFENAWPQSVDFGELDMASGEIVTVDLTLRYDRAYVVV
jgi:phage tail-like protein